jgi:hypothetical protein
MNSHYEKDTSKFQHKLLRIDQGFFSIKVTQNKFW